MSSHLTSGSHHAPLVHLGMCAALSTQMQHKCGGGVLWGAPPPVSFSFSSAPLPTLCFTVCSYAHGGLCLALCGFVNICGKQSNQSKQSSQSRATHRNSKQSETRQVVLGRDRKHSLVATKGSPLTTVVIVRTQGLADHFQVAKSYLGITKSYLGITKS